MTRSDLIAQIRKKKSFLCVGLDTDIHKIPQHLLNSLDPVYEFNKQIIDATSEYCVAYKPNLAFYEALGPSGLKSLKKTLDYIPSDIFTAFIYNSSAESNLFTNTSSLKCSKLLVTICAYLVATALLLGNAT